MRKILFGVIITLISVYIFRSCGSDAEDQVSVKSHSALIQEQVKNVGKLVVTEGYFSEVFSYENNKELFSDMVSLDKKALVVVNAKATIAFDLSKIEYTIDEKNKTLNLSYIPNEELDINPDIEFYDVQANFFNPFEADDYNKIQQIVKKRLESKIATSEFKSNAHNRLISELSKLFIVTNTLGWSLEYNNQEVSKDNPIKL